MGLSFEGGLLNRYYLPQAIANRTFVSSFRLDTCLDFCSSTNDLIVAIRHTNPLALHPIGSGAEAMGAQDLVLFRFDAHF